MNKNHLMKPTETRPGVLANNKTTLVIMTAAGLLAGAAHWYFSAPEYRSEAVIKTTSPTVEKEVKSTAFLQAAIEAAGPVNRVFIQEEYRLKPAPCPFEVEYRELGGGFKEQGLTIAPLLSGKYAVTAEVYGVQKAKTVAAGEEFVLGNIAAKITPSANKTTRTNSLYEVTLVSNTTTTEQLLNEGKLEASAEQGSVTISVTDADPARAQQLASTIGRMYANGNTGSVENGPSNLEEKLTALNNSLAETERKINAYKQKNGLTNLEGDIRSEQDYGNSLRTTKADLEMQMVALGNLHTYIRNNIGGNYSGVEYDVITDPMFAEAINRINDRYLQRAAAGLEQAASDAELTAMKETVSERILNTRKKIAVKIDQVNGQLSLHEAKMARFPVYAGTLQQMQRQLDLDKKAYEILIEKRAQEIAGGPVSVTSAVIQDAITPVVPIDQYPYKSMAMFGAVGLLIGFITASIRNRNHAEVIHNRKEAEETVKGIKYIGSVGALHGMHAASDTSFSNLSTRFLLHPNAKVITVTSSQKGEGKTFIASNFAKSLAGLDKKVLLIDMNMNAPAIADLFDVNCERTWSDVLSRKCDIHDAIYITSIPNLEIATAGTLPGGVNALLVSKDTSAIFEKLKNHYDAIIIDTPEAGKYIDAIPMMKLSDLTFYVVRANGTSKAQLENAELIRKDFGINNLFMVLNSAGKGVNHSGISAKGKYRKLKKHDAPRLSSSSIPEVLRKIALWFY